jgi:hypothetical protein
VLWLEAVPAQSRPSWVRRQVERLKARLEPFGLADSVVLCSWTGEPLSAQATEGLLELDAATSADLLIDVAYGIPDELVARFRRKALLDIDPGLLQSWMSRAQIKVAPHDVYFTIGETVGRPESRFPDCGIEWHYTPPCVALDFWPVCRASAERRFTTVTQWHAGEWMEDEEGSYLNDKRTAFLPFLDLPRRTPHSLELALCLAPEEEDEWKVLRERGWSVCHAWEVSVDPLRYRQYIQESLGEFSCAKPSCIRLQNAWISDRTLCYLASGKPAVVQHTGPSRFLPDAEGLFRFRDLEEAVRYLDRVVNDYERQSERARAIAEEHFDARKVAAGVLERAIA